MREEKMLRRFVMAFFTLALVFTCALFYMPGFHLKVVEAYEKQKAYEEQKQAQESMNGVELLQYNSESEEVDAFTQQLRIPLPQGVTMDEIQFVNNYQNQIIDLVIPGGTMELIYQQPVVGSSDHIQDISYWEEEDGLHMEFTLGSILEPVATVKKNNLYLDFLDPHKVYEKIVVIDAGHGGEDPGTVQNGVMEKDINLSILLEFQKLTASQDRIGFYYTRTADVNTPYADRAGLANKLLADLFISIHQNALKTTGAEYVNGTQVLYNEQEKKKYRPESGATGQDLARIFLTTLTNELGSSNRGLIKGHDIYIIRKAKCPTALIEVGFMSNAAEMSKLSSKAYQRLAAKAIFDGIKKAFQNGY